MDDNNANRSSVWIFVVCYFALIFKLFKKLGFFFIASASFINLHFRFPYYYYVPFSNT
jgi:hypothetical protein